MADLVGQVLAERYDVLGLLGAGGMGSVYRAHDRELDEQVALKLIHARLADSPRMVERFRHEVKLARRVTHRNVARTFELVHAPGVMFCTMELVDGESLRRRLDRGRLSPELALWIAREACAGLAAAHAAGVVHRDIKPENILLAADGRVVLADFGVAVAGVHERAGELSGTPAYMAPEQARGEPATPATDVYALGVVLYEMLEGRRAFPGETFVVLLAKSEPDPPRIPFEATQPELAAVVARAMAHDLADRIESVSELGALLAPFAETARARTSTQPPPPRALALHDVIVVAPRGDSARVHLADGVHAELLERLARLPRVRVLPRHAAPAATAGGVVIELVAGDDLAVTITGTASRTLTVPLAVDELDAAAELIASGLAAVLERPAPAEAELAARELELRAVAASRKGLHGYLEALQLAERAHALAPADPRITAVHALAYTRVQIVQLKIDAAAAQRVVSAALAAAPHRAEAHVAAGHLELATGEAPRAAVHYRTAIACSRFVADGHDGLGRLLLEAGFLDQAMARIDDALAIAPNLIGVRWEVARAHALEGDWAAHDQLVAELADLDRPVFRLRTAWWRGDLATFTELRTTHHDSFQRFEPELMTGMFAIALDGEWPQRRDRLLRMVLETPRGRRRQATVAQFAAEAAGACGDVPACMQMIDDAIDHGLFDLHWLERCPLLEVARAAPGYLRAHARVKRRADAILDALYGDAEAETSVL